MRSNEKYLRDLNRVSKIRFVCDVLGETESVNQVSKKRKERKVFRTRNKNRGNGGSIKPGR